MFQKRDDEVFQIWVNAAIEDLADFQNAGLTFLDEHRHMLQEYSADSHSIPITAIIEQEPISGGIKSFKWESSPKFNDPKFKQNAELTKNSIYKQFNI